MNQVYEPVIGLEVHAELQTRSKMFCACPVVDSTQSLPNRAVCPVCAGMPGTLPVVNQQAVEYALRVALALECTINTRSIFARKNYFYPDLPKGYQISQYEYPLAQSGEYTILTVNHGEQVVHIRRVHLEEDTGKLTHVHTEKEDYSLVDLNRAGVPLLEIVSEPDMHSIEAMRAYTSSLRALLRYLGVNSGDMEKGVIRFEANVSIRPKGSTTLGTRVEIKNLNSFRALERSVAYEIERQTGLLRKGVPVRQETLGWDDTQGVTFSQRSKEEAHDYRYFPEPDLPPLVVEDEWVERVLKSLPELPQMKLQRFKSQYELKDYDANLLVSEQDLADYFEQTLAASPELSPKVAANWILGDLFGLLNQTNASIADCPVSPFRLAELLRLVADEKINSPTAKTTLAEMYSTGQSANAITTSRGSEQISDNDTVAALVARVLSENPAEVERFQAGKDTLAQWFFGQVMKAAKGQANPKVLRTELESQLTALKRDLSDKS